MKVTQDAAVAKCVLSLYLITTDVVLEVKVSVQAEDPVKAVSVLTRFSH